MTYCAMSNREGGFGGMFLGRQLLCCGPLLPAMVSRHTTPLRCYLYSDQLPTSSSLGPAPNSTLFLLSSFALLFFRMKLLLLSSAAALT